MSGYESERWANVRENDGAGVERGAGVIEWVRSAERTKCRSNFAQRWYYLNFIMLYKVYFTRCQKYITNVQSCKIVKLAHNGYEQPICQMKIAPLFQFAALNIAAGTERWANMKKMAGAGGRGAGNTYRFERRTEILPLPLRSHVIALDWENSVGSLSLAKSFVGCTWMLGAAILRMNIKRPGILSISISLKP